MEKKIYITEEERVKCQKVADARAKAGRTGKHE